MWPTIQCDGPTLTTFSPGHMMPQMKPNSWRNQGDSKEGNISSVWILISTGFSDWLTISGILYCRREKSWGTPHYSLTNYWMHPEGRTWGASMVKSDNFWPWNIPNLWKKWKSFLGSQYFDLISSKSSSLTKCFYPSGSMVTLGHLTCSNLGDSFIMSCKNASIFNSPKHPQSVHKVFTFL